MTKKLIVLSIMLLTGCHPEGSGQLPSIPLAKQFPSAPKTARKQPSLAQTPWWQSLKSSQLNQLLAKGLQDNQDIQIACQRLEQARGQLQEVKLSWLPNMTALAGYSTNPALGIPGGFYGIWPNYLLNLVQLPQQQRQATDYVYYQQARLAAVRLLVIGEMSAAYLSLLAEQERLQLLQTLQADLQQLVRYNQDNLRIGLTSQIEVEQSLSELALIEGQVSLARHNLVLSQNALRFLINQDPGPIKPDRSFSQIDLSHLHPGQYPVTVLQNRPDLAMSAWAVRAAKAGVNIAYSNFLPSLKLDEFVGEDHLPRSTFADLSDAYFTLNLSPANLGLIQARKAALGAEIHAYIKQMRLILRDVDNAFSAHEQQQKNELAIQRAWSAARQEYLLQQGLLKSGLISDKLLLEHKLNLDNLALARNLAKHQLALSLVRLYIELAAGVQTPGSAHG